MFIGFSFLSSKQKLLWFISALVLGLALLLAWFNYRVLAQEGTEGLSQASPIHPTFALLDENGENVLFSKEPLSTMQTCGACHDTDFIASHSDHASFGWQDFSEPGEVPGGRPWDTSSGFFGRWNPIFYRYLTPAGDALLDLGTADWIRYLGAFHVGGGPAQLSRSGEPLQELPLVSGDPETHVLDPDTGEPVPWDWQTSGTVEMNCFLCHSPAPNNAARIEALASGDFRWASTATLLGTGIVEGTDGRLGYAAKAFDPSSGELRPEFIQIQDPTNENCGQCHGLVHDELEEPLVAASCEAQSWRTRVTGQIVSPQRLSNSGMNLANKESLTRSWDIHAERMVKCTDCHFSLNNPVYYQEGEATRPEHLSFDPRRLELGEYLEQPLHQFARGGSSLALAQPELVNTMRRCDGCHNVASTHDWLPYKDRHVEALSCETCHIPQIYSTAFREYDWTVIRPDVSPRTECRGFEDGRVSGDGDVMESLVEGYQPVLMSRKNVDGETKIAPFNLVSSWFWIYGDPPRPVRLQDLKAAWLEGDGYHPDILAVFDQDQDGSLTSEELALDNDRKVAAVAARLAGLGLENPRISGEVQPYSLNHNVATDEWAIQDCKVCHSQSSRLAEPMLLAPYVPGEVMPEFVSRSDAIENGELYRDEDGSLYYRPATQENDLYILGHDRVGWVDLAGSLIFAGVLFGIGLHGTLRYLASLRMPRHQPNVRRVYMYGVYERLWHWLQMFTIFGLLFTGLVIHKPDTFGFFSFRGVVLVHNILAGILLANAALSLFYHLASGEIRQYLPRPAGFFDGAVQQAIFYLRGIFRGERHPFDKSRDKKLNPLQQVTYFGLLNVLLPLQVITGILMWGVQRWPELANRMGGLPFLAPSHTLVAWLFAAFIVMHVYLTTTGHTPLASIQAMMMGWDELESYGPTEEAIEV